ncbi:MAG: hypothetical protein WCF23_14780, partial [Candidatus Nitrosopolaris sp.]
MIVSELMLLSIVVIDYDFRLTSISESTSGLAGLFVYRVAPSIEISNIIGLLLYFRADWRCYHHQ